MDQQAYLAAYIQVGRLHSMSLRVLLVSAPFQSGFQEGFQGGADYTDVAEGPLAINNAADLYLYPDTVYAVKVNGAGIKSWLEAAALRFNQIDPAKTAEQQLISTFPGDNFDMFTTADVQYEIDMTQPKGSRIKNLTYLGKAIDPAQEFVIATNNYRATSGKSFIDKLDGSGTIWASPDANRDVVIDFIRKNPSVTRTANGAAKSWRFAKATVAGPVVFSSGANALAVAQAAGLSNVSLLAADDGSGKGTSKYALDLSKNLFKIFLGIALECNRDEWMPRMRRMGWCPCKQPGRSITRFHSNPSGKWLTGRSALLHRLPIARAIGCALRLAAHPGKALVRPQKDLEQVLSKRFFGARALLKELACQGSGAKPFSVMPQGGFFSFCY